MAKCPLEAKKGYNKYVNRCRKNIQIGIKICLTCELFPDKRVFHLDLKEATKKRLEAIDKRIANLKKYIDKYIEDPVFRAECDYFFNFCKNCLEKCDEPLTLKRLFNEKRLI